MAKVNLFSGTAIRCPPILLLIRMLRLSLALATTKSGPSFHLDESFQIHALAVPASYSLALDRVGPLSLYPSETSSPASSPGFLHLAIKSLHSPFLIWTTFLSSRSLPRAPGFLPWPAVVSLQGTRHNWRPRVLLTFQPQISCAHGLIHPTLPSSSPTQSHAFFSFKIASILLSLKRVAASFLPNNVTSRHPLHFGRQAPMSLACSLGCLMIEVFAGLRAFHVTSESPCRQLYTIPQTGIPSPDKEKPDSPQCQFS